MKITQWILGVSAALSLILGTLFKVISSFTHSYVLGVEPGTFLRFTAICALASIALSLIEQTKSKGNPS